MKGMKCCAWTWTSLKFSSFSVISFSRSRSAKKVYLSFSRFLSSSEDVSKAVVRVVEEKGFLTLLSEEGVMALAALLSSPLTQLERYVQTHSHCDNYL